MGLARIVGKVALIGVSAVAGYKYAKYTSDNIKCAVRKQYDNDGNFDNIDQRLYDVWANQRTLEQLAMCKHCPCADNCVYSASSAEITVVDRLREKAARILLDLSIVCDPCVLDGIDDCDCDGEGCSCDCDKEGCDCDREGCDCDREGCGNDCDGGTWLAF